MGTNWKESADSARFRSNIYGLLATVFREEPSESLIQELKDSRLAGIFSELGVELGDIFDNMNEQQIVDALGLEFTRLFIGPENHISAHESIFTEVDGGISALWGTKTVEVKNFIETTGLGYNSEFTGVPDHIGVELEFMQKLTEWEAEKWQQKDKENAEYCHGIQRMFLEQHLLCWLPQFCDQVMAQARMPFYGAMAELCKSYIDFEQQAIDIDTAA